MQPNDAVRLSLGETEWKTYGGTISRKSHPCGRVTVTYIAPDGSKLRSWKQSQVYMVENPRSHVSVNVKEHLPESLKKNSAVLRNVGKVPPDNAIPKEMRREMQRKRKFKAGSSSLRNSEIDSDSEDVEIIAEDETTMITMTRSTPEVGTPERTVTDFVIHDGEGNYLEIDATTTESPYIGGLCISRGALDKDRPVRCELLGPVTTWGITGYEGDCVEILLSTNLADYYLDKPAPNFRKVYDPLYDKARVCRDVYRALSRSEGGDPIISLRDLELRLLRSYGNMGTSGLFFSQDYFHDIGSFVCSQLYILDNFALDGCPLFKDLPVLDELRQSSFYSIARRQIVEKSHARSKRDIYGRR